MARYRVEALSWIDGRTVQPGEEIEFAGIPGSKLTPLDDEANAAVAARGGARKENVFAQLRSVEPIPDGWEELSTAKIIALAHKIGAPKSGTGKDAAVKYIKVEIARRATV